MRIFAEESGHQVRLRLPCYMHISVHLASHIHGFIPLWKYTVNLTDLTNEETGKRGTINAGLVGDNACDVSSCLQGFPL